MKLSIIVPIYNVEQYLHKCIDSILAQTFTDFELILVDDGSTDRCPQICDEYAKKDSRIKVIHKENGGLSDARNAGIDIAQGDYLGFVDSDDYIHEQMYEKLYELATKHSAEIACCSIQDIYRDGKFGAKNPRAGEIIEISPSYIIENFNTASQLTLLSSCNKIFDKRLFQDIRYPKGKIYEDAYIFLDLIDQTTKIVRTYEQYYYYRCQRPGSTVNSAYRYGIVDRIDLANHFMDFFSSRSIKDQVEHSVVRYVDAYLINHIAIHADKKEYKKQFRPYVRQAYKRIPAVLSNKHICKLKKLIFLITLASPVYAKKMCKKYYPELIMRVE